MELRENGLLDYYSNEDVPGSRESDKCFKEQNKSAKNVPIKLVDLTSALFILGIGFGLSILCFLLELIVGKYKHEMKMRNDLVVQESNYKTGINQSDANGIRTDNVDNNRINKSSNEGCEAAVNENNDEHAIEVVTEIF